MWKHDTSGFEKIPVSLEPEHIRVGDEVDRLVA